MTIFYGSGCKYVGQVIDRTNVKEGQGTLHYPQGKNIIKYKGQFLNGKKHGFGKTEYNDGIWHKGNYQNNKQNGQGKKRDRTGLYEGNFLNGRFHGYGEKTYDDGHVYEG